MTQSTIADFMTTTTARVCVALLVAVTDCARPTAPREPGPAKLLVTNTTCASGGCATLRVLAFPENQPRTPGGYWSLDLGLVTGASGCVTIPASATFTITDTGTGETTTITWTTAMGVSLGVLPPGGSRPTVSPSTRPFIPADAAGWSVALPAGAAPTAASPCD